jgi:predicted ATPase
MTAQLVETFAVVVAHRVDEAVAQQDQAVSLVVSLGILQGIAHGKALRLMVAKAEVTCYNRRLNQQTEIPLAQLMHWSPMALRTLYQLH